MSTEAGRSRERWLRIEQIYRQALEREDQNRGALLDEACEGDAALRHEVESLLACQPAAADFIEASALDVAADLLTQEPDGDLIGRHVGPYLIEAWLGSGGMGDVYRARDGHLHREVALKILPGLFALDLDRLARFKREAQVLASLNHPNIAAIYGFEESNGLQALVLELVEGATLADRIAQGSIPVDEALPIARQIAEGLEAAHEHGIVHRDLKPSNIKVRPDGTVKVLDFGLAKAIEPGATTPGNVTDSPTITSPARDMILGTAAYMSPEQARGRHADKRSDVWAFGALLYEMLSGERAYPGDDMAATLAAVLRRDVEWTALPASTPTSVRRLMARCLDRDVKRRLRDIGGARIVLEDPATSAIADPSGAPALAPARQAWRRATPVVLAATVTGVLAGSAAWYLATRPVMPLAVTRFSFALPEGQSVRLPATRHMIALSQDGSQMVYVADTRLYLRSMPRLEVHAIQGSESDQSVTTPVFSPDGRSVAFWAGADQTIKRVAVTGGPAVIICAADNPYGIDWMADGLVFGQGSKGIMRVSTNGGTPEVLVRVKDGEEAHGPQLLPGGQHVLFTLATGTDFGRWDKARVVVQSLASGERKTLIEGGSDARYVPTGHLVYAVGGNLFAVAFDVRRLEMMGGPVPMVEDVRRSNGRETGAAHFSLSSTGSLIYIPGFASGPEWGHQGIVLTDRLGRVERLQLPPGPYRGVRASPDGTRIAFEADDGKEAIIYTYDLSGARPMQRLTFGGNNRFPVWTSDSKRVAFQSDRDGDLGIFWQSADGKGTAERLTKPDQGVSHAPESWSPMGDRFLFSTTKGSDVSLWTFSLQDRKATTFGEVHSSYPTGAIFSPDGRWVAYTTSERGMTTMTIYVQPFPATGAKYQLFVKGSSNTPTNTPHKVAWSPDGKELFYVPRLGGFEAVSVTTQPTFAFGNAVTVPRPFQPGPPNSRTLYDITPDGKFVGLMPAGRTPSGDFTAPQIQVVLNWFEELRARVPTTR
jgi:eukaryotic-like serine/threonine-protein kinase